MFRIRESFPDTATVYLWFDGRLSEQDLGTAQTVITGYLREEKKIIVNLSNLTHVGWLGKKFIKGLRNTVFLEGEPEYLKADIGP